MNTTVLKEIIAFIFGRKYYVVLVNRRGTFNTSISEYIFCEKEDVELYKDVLQNNRSFAYVDTISFRSREDLRKRYYIDENGVLTSIAS